MKAGVKVGLFIGAATILTLPLIFKAKQALDKIFIRVSKFNIWGLELGGLKVKVQTLLTNNTGFSITVTDLYCKFQYSSDNKTYTDLGQTKTIIASKEFKHGVQAPIDMDFIIDLMQVPFLGSAKSIRLITYFDVKGLPQSVITDFDVSGLKAQLSKYLPFSLSGLTDHL